MSSDRSEENLRLVKLPEKFVVHWINEVVRLYELSEVLYRSTTNLEDSRSAAQSFGKNLLPKISHRPVGDSTLVEHIKQSLSALFVEIQEVKDGHWEPRAWEEEENG